MRINIVTTNYRQGTVLALVTDVSGIRCSICMSPGRWENADDSSACWEKFLCAVRLFQSCQVTERQNLTVLSLVSRTVICGYFQRYVLSIPI